MQGLEELTRLEILDVSTNQVEQLRGLSTLTKLKDLWVNDNAIDSLEHLDEDLSTQKRSLTCIYLTGNPGVADLGDKYRATIIAMLPLLEQLDADMIA
jgi:protein phosphatase 1 regulatory subunit 7